MSNKSEIEKQETEIKDEVEIPLQQESSNEQQPTGGVLEVVAEQIELKVEEDKPAGQLEDKTVA